MIKYFKKRRQRLINEIAVAVRQELSAQQNWEKFLPPVAVGDTVYMVTENGSIYAMKYDVVNEMEKIIQLHRR